MAQKFKHFKNKSLMPLIATQNKAAMAMDQRAASAHDAVSVDARPRSIDSRKLYKRTEKHRAQAYA